ncbi:hypothetical protein Q763_03560 [Flavobacterium beibuense F44-8]|uniref:DUF1572 domain-containing protein n=1 Tax=Flavobacterium beibuense F44-8 TaxID=1406840 RepID=A0A0A2M5V1_9FLAO|nr:DUF1572 family protein [Flavobacterium beibuense]KGO83655.1 hypothetical protein Q763_03560 [Flavobacterium beibuense F44-8]
MSISKQYLDSIKKQFEYYKNVAERAMEQLEPQQLFYTVNDDSNSIAVIVKHLHGNMMSRWTDFLTTDGEKDWRNRDDEFEQPITNKENLMQLWEEGWSCFFNTINSLTPENLTDIIYIRNEGHTVMEAINRQLSHYPYHIGQIVFFAKQIKNTPWDSLTIPKNKSGEYNKQKFEQEKGQRSFLDTELNKIKKNNS